MSLTEQNPDLLKYTKLDKINSGQFGEVYKIKDIETGQIYAAKILFAPVNVNSQEDMLNLSREVNINASFDHPTVLKFIGYSPNNFENKPFPVIISEYATNGTLSRIIDLERRGLSEQIWTDTKKLINIYGIASGMSYLHANKIIHRDLKPDNILMDDRLFPKISDFGLSKRLHSDKSMTIKSKTGFKGTPIYAAPEIFKNEEQTEASDVYAFALIVYEILTTNKPYDGLDMFGLFNHVVNGKRPLFDASIDAPYKDLIERCWSQDPNDRPTFSQIVEELENNSDFITQKIEKNDFIDYIQFVNDYKKCFNDKTIIKLDNFIRNQVSNTFKRIDIRRYINEQQNQSIFGRLFKQEKLYPAADLVELNEDCRYLVTQAENDSEKQFYIGTYLIEGKNGFPIKIDLGVKYLERSISGKFIESAIYLSTILFEGKMIPKDLKKAKKLLSKHLNSKDLRVFVLYAKILLKEGNFKESRKYFEICAKEGDCYSMYKYAKMLFCGIGGNKSIDSARFYFDLSKNNKFRKSELYIAALHQCEKNHTFNYFPTETQNFLIKQIIKYKKNDDLSFTFEKIYMKYKETQMLFSNRSLKSDDFKAEMSHFKEITVEVLFPSKQFKSIYEIIYNLKPKVNILTVISGVSSISPKLNFEKTMSRAKIDDSVKRIESSSFANFSQLAEITIPSSVTLIGNEAFKYCKSLTHLTIPSSVTLIGNEAFKFCISLTHLAIPSSVTKIGNGSFNGCSSLTEIAINSPITFVENETFRGCINLRKITIPSTVKSIDQYSFCDCCRLKEITIPSSVQSIGSHAFDKCSSLVQITIPPSVVQIFPFSFAYCRRLKEINISSSVKLIGENAFYWCSSLEQITIPSSVKSIGDNAFNHCCSMKSISFQFPSEILSIQPSTFEMCSFAEITIPQSVNLIDHFAFKNCKRLKEVNLPNSLEKIEEDAFAGCSLLKIKNIPVNESQIVFKGIIMGSSCTGKTCILSRYINNKFMDCSIATIGVDFGVKYLYIAGNKVKLQIWDTSGKESFHDITRSYFISADFVIVVIDLTSYEGFDYSIRLFKEIREEIGQIPVLFLGNKCDIEQRNQLVVQKLDELKKNYDFKYLEVSAKENINVEESIQFIATETFNSYFS